MSGMVKLWKQLRAELKSNESYRTPDDFLIRADKSNELLRWRLSLLLSWAFFSRIFYFDTAYCLVATFVLFRCVHQLNSYMDSLESKVHSLDFIASDWLMHRWVTPEGKLIYGGALIDFYFNFEMVIKLPPDEYQSLLRSITEFKLWYNFTMPLFIGFLLTWIPLLRCSYSGPVGVALFAIRYGSKFSRAGREILGRAGIPGWRKYVSGQ